MKYSAVYICPLCGTKIAVGTPQEIPYNALPELCAKVVQNQMFAGNPALYQVPMYIPHKCRNGATGLAQFSGFEPAV